MVRFTRIFALVTLISCGLYYLWRRGNRIINFPTPDLHLEEMSEFGGDTGKGNILGIQPFMLPFDYASEQNFYAKLNGYLAAAAQKGWLDERSIVVFPEHIGTWLLVAGEKQAVYRAESIEQGMKILVLSNLFSFLKAFFFAQTRDRVKESLFRMKATQMAEIYHNVFALLAQKYAVTIVAGSIVLPSPRIQSDRIVAGTSNLYNTSAIYKPDGTAYCKIVCKVFPTEDERPFTIPAPLSELPVFDTSVGRLGVLICADSWYPSTYGILKEQDADLVVVPSYLAPDDVWGQLWRGYNGALAPDDVDADDVDNLTEGQAWLKYALAGRASKSGIKFGLNVFLRGRLWNMGSDGHTIVTKGDTIIEANHIMRAAITNVWL